MSGAVALTPIQAWFVEQDLAEPEHWNQAVVVATDEELEAEGLAAALDQVVRHHDALRLRFARDSRGAWTQEHAGVERAGAPVTVVDLRGEGSVAAQAEAQLRAVSAAQTSLDLAGGPLVRGLWCARQPASANRLVLVAHHLVVDGVSWRILLEDLQTAYGHVHGGRAVQLPAKTTSFQQWAAQLGTYAASAEVAGELAYWEAQGTGVSGRL